jgi:hypothetical protein
MIEPKCDVDRIPNPNRVTFLRTNGYRVPQELVEEILFEALSQEIHNTLTFLSSFRVQLAQFKRRHPSRLLDGTPQTAARKSMKFPFILRGFTCVKTIQVDYPAISLDYLSSQDPKSKILLPICLPVLLAIPHERSEGNGERISTVSTD